MPRSTTAAPTSADQRTAVRFDTAMPLRIGGADGRIDNISEHGVYFETDVPQQVGALVNFTVEFNQFGRRHEVLCEAKVVRVERNGSRIGVAARLLAPFFADEGA